MRRVVAAVALMASVLACGPGTASADRPRARVVVVHDWSQEGSQVSRYRVVKVEGVRCIEVRDMTSTGTGAGISCDWATA